MRGALWRQRGAVTDTNRTHRLLENSRARNGASAVGERLRTSRNGSRTLGGLRGNWGELAGWTDRRKGGRRYWRQRLTHQWRRTLRLRIVRKGRGTRWSG